jgi:hypothetical protein
MPELKFSPAPVIYERHKNLLGKSYVIQDGELFREEPGGTYTPVASIRN